MIDGNPFRHKAPAGYPVPYTEWVDSVSRLEAVNSFDEEELRAVLCFKRRAENS
jgi:hypothetical protein